MALQIAPWQPLPHASPCQRQPLWRQPRREAWGLLARSIPPGANACLQSHRPETPDRLLCPQPAALARQVPLPRRGCRAHVSRRSSRRCSQPCSSQAEPGAAGSQRRGSAGHVEGTRQLCGHRRRATPCVGITCRPEPLDLVCVLSSAFCVPLARQRR